MDDKNIPVIRDTWTQKETYQEFVHVKFSNAFHDLVFGEPGLFSNLHNIVDHLIAWNSFNGI